MFLHPEVTALGGGLRSSRHRLGNAIAPAGHICREHRGLMAALLPLASPREALWHPTQTAAKHSKCDAFFE